MDREPDRSPVAFRRPAGTMLEMGTTVAGSIDGARPRVAVISLHTSPLDQPGAGDSGGMNVFIRAAAERVVGRGVDVDVFTRCRGHDLPEVQELGGGSRLVPGPAGVRAPARQGEGPPRP